MIGLNIWALFVLYVIYATISLRLFFSTSGGWVTFVVFILIVGVYYIASGIGLLLRGIVRTYTRRTKVKLKKGLLPYIVGLQTFVILFNYDVCGDSICYQGFLPNMLIDNGIPVFLDPPFVLVLFALILYLGMLGVFLLELGGKS
ncbi:MAG: hypothetical protein F6K47_36725 [Symploca sp. SIO2E6]|nr:hypothetical protein [Symploca sp. SIO2E6]